MPGANLAINYSKPETTAFTGSRWLRIEQVRQDESVSLSQAADVIDALFDIKPCQDGLGNGGETSQLDEEGRPKNKPDEEQAMATMRDRLDLSVCEPKDYWETRVEVYKSHRVPAHVSLVSETAVIGDSELIIEHKTELVHVSGRSVDLTWPYHSGLRVSGAQVAGINGSTVFFDTDVDGYLSVQYATAYERVLVRVPLEHTDAAPVEDLAESAVIAFWAGMAASCELQKPPDEDVEDSELARICSGHETSYTLGGPKECWQTLEHYQMCNCSKKRINVWSEVVPAQCPEGIAPGTHYIGMRGQFEGYVYCEGEEDDVNDPEFYKEKCCVPPPRPLPRCRKTYSLWRGGAEIEGGPQRWLDIYGPGTRLIPVAPKAGICGELVTEWEVHAKNCCDDVEPLKPHPDNPELISAGAYRDLSVLEGRLPITYRASAGYYFSDGSAEHTVYSRSIRVYCAPDACDFGVVQADDNCTTVSMPLVRSDAKQFVILGDSPVVAPDQPIDIAVEHGSPPYQWTHDSRLIFVEHRPSGASFRTSPTSCGVIDVTVTDACGRMATGEVVVTAGVWREVTGFDACAAPWSGYAPAKQIDNVNRIWAVSNYHGWRAEVLVTDSVWDDAGSVRCSPLGDCAGAVQSGTPQGPCPYVATPMIVRLDGVHIMSQLVGLNTVRTGNIPVSLMCRHSWQYIGDCIQIHNRWVAATHKILRLWRWSCA